MIMNLNELVKLMLNNLDDLKIEYSLINGKESLKINDEEICTCKEKCKCNYDDSKLINKIESHKELLNQLDDCTFMDVVNLLKNNNVNLCELNKFMDKEHYTEEDELIADDYINIVSEAMEHTIVTKIHNLQSILEQL